MRKPRSGRPALALALVALSVVAWAQAPVGTAFTYQGRLTEGGAPADGVYDFQFSLYDDPLSGTLIGGPVSVIGAEVAYGLFATALDFGPVFAGEARWLEVSVRPSGIGSYTVLAPRHELTPTPYALWAATASGTGWTDDGVVVRLETGSDYVGIGTSNPGAELDVVGGVRASRFEDREDPNYYMDLANPGVAAKLAGRVGIRGAPYSDPFFGAPDLHVRSANGGLDTAVVCIGGQRSAPGDVVGALSFTGNTASGYGGYAAIRGEIVQSAGPIPKGKLLFSIADEPSYPVDPIDMCIVPGGKVGIKVDNPQARLHVGGAPGVDGIMFPDGTLQTTAAPSAWQLTGNAGTTPGLHFLGTTDATAFEVRVSGARALRVEPHGTCANLIGGHNDNAVGAGCFGDAIGGGRGNTCADSYSTISGGMGNQANGVGNAIAGGGENVTGDFYAAIGGGEHNMAVGWGTTVAGGVFNQAMLEYATVCGGLTNAATGSYSVVCGGTGNSAGLNCAFVGAGQGNQVTGAGGMIPGGFANVASGYDSFAAGYKAHANHNGTFVWADFTDEVFASERANQFRVRANGGARFDDGARWVNVYDDGTNLITTSTGARLTLAGTWTNSCDRDAKTRLEPVDSRDVLARLAALPIQTWSHVAEDPAVRHMGPVAQDFHAAFGLGNDAKSITTIDADGVALAAIQALHETVKRQDAELAAQQAALAALQARVARLEALLTDRDAADAR